MLCLCSPGVIFIVVSGLAVHGGFEVGHDEQRFDLLHDLHQFLSGRPLVASLEHVRADLPLLVDVGVVDLGLEGDHRPLEGEVVQFELNLELAALEGGLLGSRHEDVPDGVVDLVHDVAPRSKDEYSLVSSCTSLLSLGSIRYVI